MKKDIGLWLDHRKAIIILLSNKSEDMRKIISGVEKDVRFSSGDGSEHGSTEDMRDRQFQSRLNAYYDEIIILIQNANSIQIFGPGEAKDELKKRLTLQGKIGHVLSIETVDKMTDRQIIAKVRERLLPTAIVV